VANTLRIKRRTSGSAGAPSSLANAELAYNEVEDVLYIGKGTGGAGGTATTVPAIGGPGAFVSLSGAQTISGNKTFTGTVDLSSATISTISTTSNVTVGGNLTVSGTTTTVNSTTVDVADKNITLGNVGTPTDTTANGGGISLKGATDKTFNWVSSTSAWTSSEHVDLASGKAFYINGTSVLSGTALGSGVTSSSLTSVGTIGTGTWQGTAVGSAYGGTGATTYSSGQLLIGNSSGGLTKATLTAGTGVTITNASGSITINSSGTNYSAGNGLALTDTTFSTNLKANGGLVIESTAIAVDLGASAITGTLAVGDGGTGATTLTGLLKGNGTSAFTAAVDGTDYLSPSATLDGGSF